MKKNCRFLLPVFAAAALLVGCGDDSGDYSQYVTLGDYKHLAVTKTVETVTKDELQEYEKEQLADYADYQKTNGPAEDGQLLNVLLTAEAEEELIYDFSDEEGYELTLGEQEFGAEVDAALIGVEASDTLSLDVSYDAEFADAMLAGKEVHYEIVVQEISDVIYPELTDAFVKETFAAKSVADWQQSLKEILQKEHEADAQEELRNALAAQVVASCTINGYPKKLYQQKKKEVELNYQNYADMFGCSLDEIYDMLGTDEVQREQECIDAVNRKMVLEEIRKKEGLSLTEEQLQECLNTYAAENDYDSAEELLEEYDEDSLREYFLDELAIDFLEAHAEIKE